MTRSPTDWRSPAYRRARFTESGPVQVASSYEEYLAMQEAAGARGAGSPPGTPPEPSSIPPERPRPRVRGKRPGTT